jgi:hypothetical protein
MLKKPTAFRVQVTLRYSDDTGSTIEQTINVSEEQTYADFMDAMAKAYEVVRFTFGPEVYDELYKEKPEVEPDGDSADDTDTEEQ